MGDANASIPTIQPYFGRPMWGSLPLSAAHNSVFFVSEISITSGTIDSYELKKSAVAVKNCKELKKTDMKLNAYMPKMKVDPETFTVTADERLMDVEPATKLPLTRNYNLF